MRLPHVVEMQSLSLWTRGDHFKCQDHQPKTENQVQKGYTLRCELAEEGSSTWVWTQLDLCFQNVLRRDSLPLLCTSRKASGVSIVVTNTFQHVGKFKNRIQRTIGAQLSFRNKQKPYMNRELLRTQKV